MIILNQKPKQKMSKKEDEILKKINLPWITDDGYLDWGKFPIDSVLKQALSLEDQTFASACQTLASMYTSGRAEAGIFLLGLLIHNADDIVRKAAIVDALSNVETKETADLLFRELELTVSSNSTRKYINGILKALKFFPVDFVAKGFEGLLGDDKWSYRMKTKFKEIIQNMDYKG